MKAAALLTLLAACAPALAVPPAASPARYIQPSSLPVEKCADDIDCWRRRTLLYVETNELLTGENKTLGTERDDAREGENYARNVAEKFKKEAEPSWTSDPRLWLGLGVIGGIVLSIGAGLVWGAAEKAVK